MKSSGAEAGVAALDDLFQPVNRADVPGLVVGVAQHGRTLYRRGFGLASIELAVANTPWTRMRIGSASKQFTCLAALLLAEEGKLDIDAGVRAYIPELLRLQAEPTLRQLMTHIGGCRCSLDLSFIASGMAIRPKGADLRILSRQSQANFSPGERMLYSNGGFHLLSLIIERVSGVSLPEFLQHRIFTPLSMVDTASVPSDFEIHPGIATAHVALPEGRWRRGLLPSEEVLGEGAVVSTIDDMLRWLAHLRGTKFVGSESTWKQMLTPARLNNGLVSEYALGLFRHSYRGIEIVHHSGYVIGGACQMLTVPRHELDIIIIANGAKANVKVLATKILDTIVGAVALGPSEIYAASGRFRPMLGTLYYSRSSHSLIGFADIEGKLGLSLFNSAPVPLRDEGETLRVGIEDVAAGPFVLNTAELTGQGNPPAALTVAECGYTERFELLHETAPTTGQAGTALAGRYRVRDLGAEARIEFDGEKLKLRILSPYGINHMTLTAFTADVWGVRVDDPLLPLQFMLAAERDHGEVKGLCINTLRTRHLHMERLPD